MTEKADISTSSEGTQKTFDSKQAVPSEPRESRPTNPLLSRQNLKIYLGLW